MNFFARPSSCSYRVYVEDAIKPVSAGIYVNDIRPRSVFLVLKALVSRGTQPKHKASGAKYVEQFPMVYGMTR